MPVFEYQCQNCGKKYDIYHRSLNSQEEVVCPECKSKESRKLFSSFSASVEGSHSHGFEGGCASGACGMPDYGGGGCASGMCGLN